MKCLQTALCTRRTRTPQLETVAIRRNATSPETVQAFHKALSRRGASADVHESEIQLFGRTFVVASN